MQCDEQLADKIEKLQWLVQIMAIICAAYYFVVLKSYLQAL